MKTRDPLHQDYLDACEYEAELNKLEQIFECPVDIFGQPINSMGNTLGFQSNQPIEP